MNKTHKIPQFPNIAYKDFYTSIYHTYPISKDISLSDKIGTFNKVYTALITIKHTNGINQETMDNLIEPLSGNLSRHLISEMIEEGLTFTNEKHEIFYTRKAVLYVLKSLLPKSRLEQLISGLKYELSFPYFTKFGLSTLIARRCYGKVILLEVENNHIELPGCGNRSGNIRTIRKESTTLSTTYESEKLPRGVARLLGEDIPERVYVEYLDITDTFKRRVIKFILGGFVIFYYQKLKNVINILNSLKKYESREYNVELIKIIKDLK